MITLTRFLLDTYAPLRQLSGRTIAIYQNTLDRLADHLGRDPTLDDLTDVGIARFLTWRLETPHRGKLPRRTTVAKDRTQLLALASLAFRKRLIPEDVTLPPFRAAGRLPRGYMLEDIETLVAAGAAARGTIGGLPAGWWWQTLLTWCWESGARIGETLALRWDCVDLADRRVLLVAETRKLKTRDIERRISPELTQLLSQHARDDHAIVWPWDRGHTYLWKCLQRLCKKSGVTPRGFHGLRKAAASYYAQAGGNPVDLLDHSDGGALYQKHYRDSRIATGGPAPVDVLPRLNVSSRTRADTLHSQPGQSECQASASGLDAEPPCREP